ncbi:Halocyanin [Rubellimicrobium mesophilum DSM 19309]|uniref:Halocyanin n=1 Tax=Rubellimicrobium mesophilum DSM 19309 TaxID=442562 RepID=A0A017HIQ4_9RHOB|nr:plastocyanin/azurin family copper-binding protein [Rubellimicrobium mesophilum]EYD74241.1 Halocyanin [Rubellimicrobium mesophilum DSM 19309]
MWTRRHLLARGGGGLAALAAPRLVRAAGTEVLGMRGSARGERVWFAPQGLAVAPGTTLRWTNRDPGNSHTTTAYHPDLYGRPLRIPEGATPWDSGLLLPDESFEVTLERPGVYDYYCQPHEMAGMVGRIVVGQPGDPGWEEASADPGDLPDMALMAFPTVEAILAAGRIDEEEPT